jgi:Tol biopolymer transport system component
MTRMTALAAAAALTLSACTDALRPTDPTRVETGVRAGVGSPAFGSKIAFTSDRDEPNVSAEIYVVNADGSGERQLTDLDGYNSNAPAWSPNGRRIAFHSNRGGGVGESDIYVMNADGSDVTRLTWLWPLGLGGAHFANWSPDGEKLVFNSFFEGGTTGAREIWVVDADGTGLANLTNHPSDDTRPDWSPDGTLVAFQSNRSGNAEIFVMRADGSDGTTPRRLTFSPGPDAAPEWSPDGTRIAFQSSRTGNSEIWVMNADGTSPTQLTFYAGVDAKPSWSHDGSRIAFHRDVSAFGEVHGQLFTMNADGSDVTMISTPTPFAFNGFASWAQGHAAAP